MNVCKKSFYVFLMMNVLIFVLFLDVNAGTFEEKKYEIGIAGGVLRPTDVYVSAFSGDVPLKQSFLIKGYVDSYLIPNFAVGLYLNYTTINLKENINMHGFSISNGIPVYEFGGSMKARYILSPKIAVKPGISFGHRTFAGDNDFSKWRGFALNGSCEFQYLLNPKYILYQETGFLFQPFGGNEDTDITFDPTLYLIFGVAF